MRDSDDGLPRRVVRVPYVVGLVVAVAGVGLVVVGTAIGLMGSWRAWIILPLLGLVTLRWWQQSAVLRSWERYVMPALWLGLWAAASVAAAAGRAVDVVAGLLGAGVAAAVLTAGAFNRRLTIEDDAILWGPFRRQ